MKYLKKYNESKSYYKLNEVKIMVNDILLELTDMGYNAICQLVVSGDLRITINMPNYFYFKSFDISETLIRIDSYLKSVDFLLVI